MTLPVIWAYSGHLGTCRPLYLNMLYKVTLKVIILRWKEDVELQRETSSSLALAGDQNIHHRVSFGRL